MSLVAGMLTERDIAINVALTSKPNLFEFVGALIESRHGLASATVVESLLSRERLGSTGLGEAVAIPHGRIKGLTQAIAVFVRPQVPLAFDSPDGKAVDEIFVLLVPESATDHHLMILSELAQRFSNRVFREAIRAASSEREIIARFADIPK